MVEKDLSTSFFDIQVHLLIHLVDEIDIVGVVSFCWIFWVERFMGFLKSLLFQKAWLEGSMAKGWMLDESMYYLAMYLGCIDEATPPRWIFEESLKVLYEFLYGKDIP